MPLLQGSTESLHADNTDLHDEDDESPPPFATPIVSATSTPRSNTPEPQHQITVTVNNYVTGNLNFVPVAPPNSPRRRGSRTRKRTQISGNEADVESQAGDNTMEQDIGSSTEELSDLSSSRVPYPQSPLVRGLTLEPIPSSPPPAYTEHASDEEPHSPSTSPRPLSTSPRPPNEVASQVSIPHKVDASTSTSPSLQNGEVIQEQLPNIELARPALAARPRSLSDAPLFAREITRLDEDGRHSHSVSGGHRSRRSGDFFRPRHAHRDSESPQFPARGNQDSSMENGVDCPSSPKVQPKREDIFMFPPDDRSRESSTDPCFLSGEEDNGETKIKVDHGGRITEEESGLDSDEGLLEDINQSSEDLISTRATRGNNSVFNLTEDLSDLTLSPTVEDRVSFRTEVASSSSSPHHEIRDKASE